MEYFYKGGYVVGCVVGYSYDIVFGFVVVFVYVNYECGSVFVEFGYDDFFGFIFEVCCCVVFVSVVFCIFYDVVSLIFVLWNFG